MINEATRILRVQMSLSLEWESQYEKMKKKMIIIILKVSTTKILAH